jgi:hypothetical protein
MKELRLSVNSCDTVQQQNSSDCGVCTLINMVLFFDNNFDQNKKIVYDYELIQKFRYIII